MRRDTLEQIHILTGYDEAGYGTRKKRQKRKQRMGFGFPARAEQTASGDGLTGQAGLWG